MRWWVAVGSVLAALMVLVALQIWRGKPAPPPVPAVPVEQADAGYLRARVVELEGMLETERGLVGELRARLRGLEQRGARVVTVTDTLIDVRTVPVYLGLTGDRHGRVDVIAALPGDSLHRGAVLEDVDLADCDDGFAMQGTRIVCNRAQLGHLGLVVRPTLVAETVRAGLEPLGWDAFVGLRWERSFRSTLAVEVGRTRGRWALQGEWGVRLF